MKVCSQGLALCLGFKLSRVLQGILLEAFEARFRPDYKGSRTWPTCRFEGIGSFNFLHHFRCHLIAGAEFGCNLLRERLSSGMANHVICRTTLKRYTIRSGSKTWTSDTVSTTANLQTPTTNLR